MRPADEIRLIARHVGVHAAPDRIAEVANATRFVNVKQKAADLLPRAEVAFRGGARSFVFLGTNRRWVNVLTDDDLDVYATAAARELTPECAIWLENGRQGAA